MTKADNDHATKVLAYAETILTEDIGGLSEQSVKDSNIGYSLMTIGDIVLDRNEGKLFDIINNQNDLQMLIALSKADMYAINPEWAVTIHSKSMPGEA